MSELPVSRPHFVRERGPELFVPGASRRIETNSMLRRLSADGTAAVAGGSSNNTTNRGPVTFSPTFHIRGENLRRPQIRLTTGCAGFWQTWKPSSGGC